MELEYSGQDWQKEYCPTSRCPCKPTPPKKKPQMVGHPFTVTEITYWKLTETYLGLPPCAWGTAVE